MAMQTKSPESAQSQGPDGVGLLGVSKGPGRVIPLAALKRSRGHGAFNYYLQNFFSI